MNLPMLLDVLDRGRDREPDRLLEHQQDRLPDVRRGSRPMRRALRERRFRAIAMSVFASGAIPPREAIEWVCAQPNVESIVFGASSRRQHPRAPASSSEDSGERLTTLLVASTGGHLKQLHRLHRRLRGHRRPLPLGDLRHPAEPLAARRRGGRLRAASSADATRSMWPRNLPAARRILREHAIDTVVSTGSAVALPFFAVARARRLDCHYIESAARIEGPSVTGRLMTRDYRCPPLRAVLALGERRLALPRLGVRRLRSADEDGARLRPASQGRGHAGHLQGVRLSSGSSSACSQILPAEAEVLWQTGDTDVGGLGIDGQLRDPRSAS